MIITMRLFQRNLKGKPGNWYIEFDGGKRRSLETKDKMLAKRLYRQIEREYLKGKVFQITGTCRKALIDFNNEFLEWSQDTQNPSTFKANRLALRKLMHHAGERTTLDRISLKHIDLMIAEEKRKGLSVRSINNYIRHARTVLNKAVEWKYVKSNPLAKAKELKVQRTRPKFLEKKDISVFINSIKDMDLRRLVTAYIATGRRRSELLNLRWEDIDIENREYSVITKGGYEKTFPINAVFMSVLLSIGIQKDGKVFPQWEHPDTVTHYVKRALVDAGFPSLSLHSLRHTFASLKAGEGRTLKEIQELLGHSEQKITEIYAHLTDERISEIAEVNLGPIDIN